MRKSAVIACLLIGMLSACSDDRGDRQNQDADAKFRTIRDHDPKDLIGAAYVNDHCLELYKNRFTAEKDVRCIKGMAMYHDRHRMLKIVPRCPEEKIFYLVRERQKEKIENIGRIWNADVVTFFYKWQRGYKNEEDVKKIIKSREWYPFFEAEYVKH